MPTVEIEPDRSHPLRYDVVESGVNLSLMEELAVAGNTAELQHALGASLEVDDETAEKEKSLLKSVIKNRDTSALTNQTTAFAAAAFLRTYGQHLAFDAAQARAAITNKLMELANCGEPKYELKALELLGKHSDIGIFTERSEITINYGSPEELENAIKERIKKLMNADVIDVTPIVNNLDDELGVFKMDVEEEATVASESDAEGQKVTPEQE